MSTPDATGKPEEPDFYGYAKYAREFEFVEAESDKWLLVNRKRGYAFKVNDYTKRLAESLILGANWEHAYSMLAIESKISILNGESDIATYKNNARKMIEKIKSHALPPRRRLTVAITLLPARSMGWISHWFIVLINSYVFTLNVIIAVTFLVYTYLQNKSNIALILINAPSHLLYIVLLVAASFVFHEIGHGAALNRFSHKPGRLGIGLFLVYPVFYTEFLTIQMMRPTERCWVDISGSYFQILFANILIILTLDQGNAAWMVVAAWLIYGAAAIQLIPINSSDGYWLAHDALLATGQRKLFKWFEYSSNALMAALLSIVVARALFTLTSLLRQINSTQSLRSIAILLIQRNWMTIIVILAAAFLLIRFVAARIKMQRVRRGASNFRGTSTGVGR